MGGRTDEEIERDHRERGTRMTWQLLIPRALVSANARIVNSGPTRWAYAKARKAWVKDIGNAMLAIRVPDASGKRRITLTRLLGKGQGFFDDDDLSGGAKFVRDAMQRPYVYSTKNGVKTVEGASLIITDGEKDAEFIYKQQRAVDGKAATLITVEDLS
jgi:hypothetical protein